jgi:hypothetical protein
MKLGDAIQKKKRSHVRLHDSKETFMTPSNSIARLEIGIPKEEKRHSKHSKSQATVCLL